MVLMFIFDVKVDRNDKQLLTRFKSRNFQEPPQNNVGTDAGTLEEESPEEEKFKFSDLKKLGL